MKTKKVKVSYMVSFFTRRESSLFVLSFGLLFMPIQKTWGTSSDASKGGEYFISQCPESVEEGESISIELERQGGEDLGTYERHGRGDAYYSLRMSRWEVELDVKDVELSDLSNPASSSDYQSFTKKKHAHRNDGPGRTLTFDIGTVVDELREDNEEITFEVLKSKVRHYKSTPSGARDEHWHDIPNNGGPNECTVTILDPVILPSAPTGGQAEIDSFGTRMSLSWNPPNDDGDARNPLEYTVYVKTDNGSWDAKITNTQSTGHHLNGSFSGNIKVKITAINSAGEGPGREITPRRRRGYSGGE